MKHIYTAALCLCLLLTACAQTAGQPPEQTTAGTQSNEMMPTTSDATSSQEAPTSNEPALYFCGELADPQSMVPVYEPGTLTFEGTFTPLADGSYETALHLTQYFPHGIDLMTGEPQPEGYMNLGYDSIGDAIAADLPLEAKAAMDEKSAGDTGRRQYGLLPMRTRSTANTMQTTGSFYLPSNYNRHFSSTMELPYLLTTNGDKAVLYLYLNPLATVTLEGALTVPPVPQPHQTAVDMQLLYFNDEGRSPERNKQKNVWNILFLGEKSGDCYGGTLHLWRWREQTGAAPTNPCYIPREASAYEQAINLEFQPFDDAQYLSAGGRLNERQRARLTGMATVDCGGQQVLFTICCETVYAELPSVHIGAFEGRFTVETDIERIHEESLTLYQLAHNYHLSPLSPVLEDLPASVGQVGNLTQENTKICWGVPSDVPGFLPAGFVKMLRPVGLSEKRPVTLGSAVFQYTEDGYWLETIGPLYRQQLAGMRDLQIEEGETSEGTGYEMEITFHYGERTIEYSLMDTSIGTGVSITIY